MNKATKEQMQKHCERIKDSRVRFDNYDATYKAGDTVRLRGNKNGPCMVIRGFKTEIARIPEVHNAVIWNGIYYLDYITQELQIINGVEVTRDMPMSVKYHVDQLELCDN